MEFLLLILGIAVVWAIVNQSRSEDRRRIGELFDLLRRLEQRISTMERSTSRPAAAPTADAPAQIEVKPKAQAESAFVPHSAHLPQVERPAATASPVPASMPARAAAAPPPPQPAAAYYDMAPAMPLQTSTYDTLQEPEVPKHSPSLEERFGTNWLNKLGIIILVIGVSLFLAYQLRTMGPAGKTAVGAVLSLGLLMGGLFLERNPRYRIFARAGIGGGWALTFFLSYAMYHIEATHVISSQLADLILMLAVAVGMVVHSLRYKSQVVTGLAFLLAFVTVGISGVTLFSLVAGALLAAGLVYVTAREYWYELGLAGLVGVYLNHFLWLHRMLPDGGIPGHPFPEFSASAGLLLLYWFIFRLAYILRVPRSEKEERLASGTALLNSVGLMGLLKYQSSHPDWAFWALIALGTAEMFFALFAWQRRRPAFVMLSSLASILLLAAIPFRFSGSNWSLLWLLEAEALFFAGLRLREPVFRRLGLTAGFAAAVQLLFVDATPIFELRQNFPDATHHWPAAIAFLSGALLFWVNAHLAPLRWKELLEHEFDAATITVTSYAGLVSAGIGLWIAVPGAGTVVAWMLLSLLLALAADKLGSGDLATQADLLAAATIVRIGLINLMLDSRWGAVSQRAVSVGAATALFYLGMWRKTKALFVTSDYVPAAYSWAGSTLLGLLVWYELRPISVAVGWGVLGLVLFEIGFLLRRSYLRQQGYVLLAASFVRIFFVNFSADGSSHFNSPRLYTVLPLIAAYLWVYERLQGNPESSLSDRVTQQAAAWAALIALTTLAYFEVDAEWVIVAWAILIFALLATAWLLKRPIFTAQSLVLLLVTGTRAVIFNLFSSPLLTTAFWNNRTISITETCVILLLALPIAFQIRKSASSSAPTGDLRDVFSFFVEHPEQGLFFVPLILATVFLAIQMRAGMITVSWSALGVFVFLFALLLRERSYRLAGLALLLLGVGKIIVVDIWSATPSDRYITLIVMGASLLLISFLYTRYREAILKLL